MKKILTLLVALIVSVCVNAQTQTEVDNQASSVIQNQSLKDGFFSNGFAEFRSIDGKENLPMLPTCHGLNDHQNAPLGSGLLILAGLGLGYAITKRKQ